jgi:hypothetical protein
MIADIGPISLFAADDILHSADEVIYAYGYSNIVLVSCNFRRRPPFRRSIRPIGIEKHAIHCEGFPPMNRRFDTVISDQPVIYDLWLLNAKPHEFISRKACPMDLAEPNAQKKLHFERGRSVADGQDSLFCEDIASVFLRFSIRKSNGWFDVCSKNHEKDAMLSPAAGNSSHALPASNPFKTFLAILIDNPHSVQASSPILGLTQMSQS